MQVKIGDPIPLALQASDDDTGLFPRAILYDASGAPLGSNPTDLAHVSGGLYKDLSVLMPNSQVVFAQYRVYQDSGHTIRHPLHSDTLLDIFERATLDVTVQTNAGDISGYVDDIEMGAKGFVDDLGGLVGTIVDVSGLSGFVSDEEEILYGSLDDSGSLTGLLHDC
jgi:hypothetical protein